MGEQWAKVPEDAAYLGLDATAYRVLIILAAKAGRDRVAWISQRTIGERFGLTRQAIGKAMRRLERVDLIRPAGTVVIDHERGTWVRKYKVAPYLPEATPGVSSGSGEMDPMQLRGDPMQLGGGPDATPGVSHSVPQGSVPIDQAASASEPLRGSPPPWAAMGYRAWQAMPESERQQILENMKNEEEAT